MTEFENEVVIVDVGSCLTRVGFENDTYLRYVFYSILVRINYAGVMAPMDAKFYYVGDEALSRKSIFSLGQGENCYRHTKIRKGKTDPEIWCFNLVEKLMHHSLYKEARITPEEHPIVLTVSPLDDFYIRSETTSNQKRSIMKSYAKMMFETFSVPKLFIVNRALLSLYRTGRKTGVVVHCGAEHTYSCAIINGTIRNVIRGGKSGNDLTREIFRVIFNDPKLEYPTTKRDLLKWKIAEILNRDTGYISSSEEDEKNERIQQFRSRIEKIKLEGSELFMYFLKNVDPNDLTDDQITKMFHENPVEYYFSSDKSLQKITIDCIEQLKEQETESTTTQKLLYSNIVLTGGTSMIPGFVEKFKESLEKENSDFRLISLPDRHHQAWTGATLLAFDEKTKKEVFVDRLDDDGFEGDEFDYERYLEGVVKKFKEDGKRIFENYHPDIISSIVALNSYSDEDESIRVKDLVNEDGCFFDMVTERGGKDLNVMTVKRKIGNDDNLYLPKFLLLL